MSYAESFLLLASARGEYRHRGFSGLDIERKPFFSFASEELGHCAASSPGTPCFSYAPSGNLMYWGTRHRYLGVTGVQKGEGDSLIDAARRQE